MEKIFLGNPGSRFNAIRAVVAFPALMVLLLVGFAAQGEVVRRAPAFAWSAGKTSASFRGQPVVLVIAPSPKSKIFRKQVARLQESYEEFAARHVVFAVAFSRDDSAGDLRSSIPFVVARNGAQVASNYQVTGKEGFALVVIGKDGNLDLQTAKLSPAAKVRDTLLNAGDLQAAERHP